MFDAHSLVLMLQAFCICLVLTGIHGYLGIHVLERKVIFVDLAMAQIAALGATYALFLGYDQTRDPAAVYLFSLTFTLAGAAVFSLTRVRYEKIPQEAFIGIVYATASAIAILILAKSTTAGEQIKGMLVGNILNARWPDVAMTGGIYAVIGAFHWVFREKFFMISMQPEEAFKSGLNVRLWDFLFYASFGIVITSSVAIAGVLLVFSFLVVPSAIGIMFAESRARRLTVAWIAGTVVSFIGIVFTFWEGTLPVGPAVVAAFALVLLLSGLARYVMSSQATARALARIGVGVVAFALLAGGSWLLRKAKPEVVHTHESEFERMIEELRSDNEAEQLHAIDHLKEEPDPHALPELLKLLNRTDSDRVIEHMAETLHAYKNPDATTALKKVLERDLDASLRYKIAECLLAHRDVAGLPVLIDIFGDEDAARLSRVKARRLFEKRTGRKVGDDVDKTRDWWKNHGDHLKWREQTGRFE